MAKYKFLAFFVLTFCVKFAAGQQYTPMTANGYQMKRVKADSTLHLPSFCGVPTLRSSTAIQGALALDTCNNKLYKWTNQAGWTEVAGGGGSTDTTSLSNRIDQRVKYTDTASMLLPYLEIIDTTGKFVANVTKKNDSTITVIKGTTQTDILLPRGSGGGGTPTDTTSLSNRINNAYTTITKLSDTSFFLTKPNTLKDTIKFNKDVVYTQSPIMSMVSNDSNIIYFNADTANAWRNNLTDFGSGTNNRLAKWNADTLQNSSITDNGTTVVFANAQNLQIDQSVSRARITATSPIIQGTATSGDRLTLGTIGGNTTSSTNEVIIGLGDVSSSTGTKNALNITGRLLHSAGSTQEVNFLNILPTIQQTGTSSNIMRGIYYNPTFSTAFSGSNIALQTTSGDVILRGLKNRSTTTDSIAVFHNDTLKKTAFTTFSSGFVPYVGATQDVDLAANKISARSVYIEGTNGDGHLHLKHQNADATATGQSTSLYADNNGDIKWKNAGNFYTTLKTSGNTANRVYTYPNATTTLIGASDTATMLSPYQRSISAMKYTDSASMLTPYLRKIDTAVFDRKSAAAYTFRANNTGSAANMTDISFRQSGMQTYTGTIVFGGTAPSGATNHTYNFTQVGNLVTLNVTLIYATAGTSVTTITLPLPADCPAPKEQNGLGATNDILYYGIFQSTQNLAYSNTARNCVIRKKSATVGDVELTSTIAASNNRLFVFTIQYFTN